MAYGRQYTEQERQFIADNCHRGVAWIADAMGLTGKQASGYFCRHKLRSGINTRFKKGETRGHRWQKGEQASPSTQFKTGHTPPQTAPEGYRTVRQRRDKSGRDYLFIHTGGPRWSYLHRYVWITFFGPIPPGKLVVFADGDPLNCHPDNLRLIDRRQHARRNHNPQKQAQTIQSGKASSSYYASRLYMKDRKMRAFVLDYEPELVQAKANQIKLKHQLNQFNSHEP